MQKPVSIHTTVNYNCVHVDLDALRENDSSYIKYKKMAHKDPNFHIDEISPQVPM